MIESGFETVLVRAVRAKPQAHVFWLGPWGPATQGAEILYSYANHHEPTAVKGGVETYTPKTSALS